MVADNQEQEGGAIPLPDEQGFYGPYGGRYVPEMLVPALDELEEAYQRWKDEDSFVAEVDDLLKNYSGRPTPLYFACNLTEHLGGAKIYLKQEGLGATRGSQDQPLHRPGGSRIPHEEEAHYL